jgi:fructokinase
VRLANDANCFALSEAVDGAGRGAPVVFGAILGTGCGGGVVVGGALQNGLNGIAGEWGHSPLPWPTPSELAPAPCWCGRRGCLETWVSGPAFENDYAAASGRSARAPEIIGFARAGEAVAVAALERYAERLGRALAVICDILDPDIIVLGGGMSNAPEIYPRLLPSLESRVFSDSLATRVTPAVHGDSSGVRGAAWLWPPA